MESEHREPGAGGSVTGGSATGSSPVSGVTRTRLSPAEFAVRFQDGSRALWCIAVSVTGDRSGADDLVQEAAVVALGKLHEFDPATNFVAWMGQIVRFLALNARRKATKARPAGEELDGVADARGIHAPNSGEGISSRGGLHAHQSDFDDEVAAAVNELDETPRACLLMKTVLDLSYHDISLALSIPEGTAMSHVHRARKLLRDKLASHPLARGGQPA